MADKNQKAEPTAPQRNALLALRGETPEEQLDELKRVRAYLPTNYAAHFSAKVKGIVIAGTDEAGWTLDGYVIPRLASGLLFAKEYNAKELST